MPEDATPACPDHRAAIEQCLAGLFAGLKTAIQGQIFYPNARAHYEASERMYQGMIVTQVMLAHVDGMQELLHVRPES